MEKIPHKDLHIVSLSNRHELNSFKCKSDDLNDFLKTDALKDQEGIVSKTYLCYWKEKIVGLSVSDIISCRYLTVDSKTDSIDFYKKIHFKIVEKYKKTEFPKMYIDMYPIVAAMRPKETLERFEI